MGTETTRMAYSACEAVVMARMETEKTRMAYSACEAVVMAHMGTLMDQNVRLFVSCPRHINVKCTAVLLKLLISSGPIQKCRLRRMLQIKLVSSRLFVAPD